MREVIHLSYNNISLVSHVPLAARTTSEKKKAFFIACSFPTKKQHGLHRKHTQMNLDNTRSFVKQCLIVSPRATKKKKLYAKITKHISVCSTRFLCWLLHILKEKAHDTTERGEPSRGIIPRSYSWITSRKDTPRMDISILEQECLILDSFSLFRNNSSPVIFGRLWQIHFPG